MTHCNNVNNTSWFLHLWKYHILLKLCFHLLIKHVIVSFYQKCVIQKPKPQHVVFYKTIASWLAHHCDSTTRFRTQDARIAIETLFTKNISLNWLQFFIFWKIIKILGMQILPTRLVFDRQTVWISPELQ